MDALSLAAIAVFGLGGVFALAIVPWMCIGTGLKDANQDYIGPNIKQD